MTERSRIGEVDPIAIADDLEELVEGYLLVCRDVLVRSQQCLVQAEGLDEFRNDDVGQEHVLLYEVLRLYHRGLLEAEGHVRLFVQSEDKLQVVEQE